MALDSSNRRNHQNGSLPEGAALDQHLSSRNRRAKIWLAVFQAAILISIVALGALLFNIANDSVGLVAVQNEVNPETLVLRAIEDKMLSMPNTVSGEDDTALAAAVAADPYAIGVFGYAYYQAQADGLKALAVNGTGPSAETAESGTYDLARPLFLYAPFDLLKSKPEVAGFLHYYLDHVNAEIVDVGYFPGDSEMLAEQVQNLEAVVPPQDGGYPLEGDIAVSGSSTVYPLSQRMAERYQQAGFTGAINVESTGTTAGLVDLCVERLADVAAASRPITRYEADACSRARIDAVEFRVGTDALAVAVSSANTFLGDVSFEQLQRIFTSAEKWSDVDPSWPGETIRRYIPSGTSGTLDFFVEQVFAGVSLRDLPKETLATIFKAAVSTGVLRRFESEKPLADRTQEEIFALVQERVVKPKVVASWNLVESLLQRDRIEAETFEKYPDAVVEWKSWINLHFLLSPQSSVPEQAGVRTAILGSLWIILITVIFAVPIGMGAAIYLEEYAGHGRINRVIQTNIDNLAGVPSIIYGILGLAVFVRALALLTSGEVFGIVDPTTANGRTIVSAGLTLGLLVMPVVIINSQEAIRAVPSSLREAAYALGATKWQVVRSHVLSNALPGIMTGIILAVSRAIGETAPLVVIGASTFVVVDPADAFAKFTALPVQIYQWTSRPQAEFRHIAAAAGIVLLLMLFALNGAAIYTRNRFGKKF